MVLSDRVIKTLLAEGKIVVEPLGEGCIQPASVDVHLDKHILVFRNSRRPFIDVREDLSDLTEMEEIGEQPFMLHPGEFVLGSTLETIELPDDLVARLEGKSSLGRIGLLIHSTAGYVSRLEGPSDVGAEQCGESTHHAVSRHEDRAALISAAIDAGGQPLRFAGAGQQVPRADRAHSQPRVPGF